MVAFSAIDGRAKKALKTEKAPKKEAFIAVFAFYQNGAGEAIRTPDPNLGKVMLYP
jgi:hypothetical protein